MDGQTAPVILLGVTGGIGMGKSRSAAIYQRLGFPVVDTDQVARDVVAPGTPGLAEVVAAFGPEILTPEGGLDRPKMAERVFRDAAVRGRLEAILHPRIRAQWQGIAETWRRERRPLGVIIIPLLYETAVEKYFDVVVCVACSEAAQRERLRQRGWTDEHLARRLASQMPVSAKIQRANFVVWTEPPEAVHEQQVRRVLDALGVRGGGGGGV